MTDQDLCYLTATEAVALFKARKLSPVELLEAMIRRAEAVESSINAFTDTYFEEALDQARFAEQRYMRGDETEQRPLEGVAVAVKDAQRLAGKRTTYGSCVLADNADAVSDPMIERLQNAGAIIHARTTTPEFCLSGTCTSRLWGTTRNPFNRHYGPGGSSGGSAASLAAGTTTLATGTDIGGSIRIPASCCGVVGYKPPKGRNPDGFPANVDPYNHCGPLARSVADAALVQNIVSGPHSHDHSSLRDRVVIPRVLPGAAGLRVAWSMDFGYMAVDREVRQNTLAALEVFRELGCVVEEVEIGWTAECDKAALAWYSAMHFGRQPLWHSRANEALLTDYALAAAKAASQLGPDDVARSWETQHAMHQVLARIMEDHDILVCPTTTVPAIAAEQDMLDQDFTVDGRKVDAEYGWILTHHFNMLHNCPVMSVPSGRSASGVPTGIQIVGRTFDDLTVFRAASAYEAAVGGWFEAEDRPDF